MDSSEEEANYRKTIFRFRDYLRVKHSVPCPLFNNVNIVKRKYSEGGDSPSLYVIIKSIKSWAYISTGTHWMGVVEDFAHQLVAMATCRVFPNDLQLADCSLSVVHFN